jgi:SprT-like family
MRNITTKRFFGIAAIAFVASGILVWAVMLLVLSLINAIYGIPPPSRFWVTPLVRATDLKKCEGLNVWYDEYNDLYFAKKLPSDVVIDYSETGPFMATTAQMPDGRFHIALNEKYTSAPRVAHLIIQHEQCHIKTWGEQKNSEHGKLWRACMLTLDAEGAFRAELIDGYRENL